MKQKLLKWWKSAELAFSNWCFDFIFSPRLVCITFYYTEQYAHNNPIYKEHPILAKVRKTAMPTEIMKLFPFPDFSKTKFEIKDIKIQEIYNLPRV